MSGQSRSDNPVKDERATLRGQAAAILVSAVLVLSVLVPQQSRAADLLVGDMNVAGEAADEGIMVNENMQDLISGAADMSALGDVMPDYDILIEVPVQLENIRDNVDRFRLRCRVGRTHEDSQGWMFWTDFFIDRNIVDGSYNGILRFPIVFPLGEDVEIDGDPPDMIGAMDFNKYACWLHLHDQVSDWWEYASTNPDKPTWAQSSTSPLTVAGPIDW